VHQYFHKLGNLYSSCGYSRSRSNNWFAQVLYNLSCLSDLLRLLFHFYSTPQNIDLGSRRRWWWRRSVHSNHSVSFHPLLRLTHARAHSLTHSLRPSLTHSLMNSLTHSLTHSFTHSFTRSLIHSRTHSLTHSLSYPPIYSITHLPKLSFTHWLSHSFTH
jgi:hypothetical protein